MLEIFQTWQRKRFWDYTTIPVGPKTFLDCNYQKPSPLAVLRVSGDCSLKMSGDSHGAICVVCHHNQTVNIAKMRDPWVSTCFGLQFHSSLALAVLNGYPEYLEDQIFCNPATLDFQPNLLNQWKGKGWRFVCKTWQTSVVSSKRRNVLLIYITVETMGR